MNIPFFKPALIETEINEVTDSLKSGWLTTGPKTKLFEQAIADYVGVKYAVALNSCTAALHLALEALGVSRGDLVLVPTFTFGATAEVVRYFDAIPVFVDCDNDFNISVFKLEETIQRILDSKEVAGLKPPYGKIKAVVPMHYAGYCCNMNEILAICDKYQLKVIEDAAHTFPAKFRSDSNYEWKFAGTFGDVGCYSFYANKCITTGEGGMAVTDNQEIADRIRVMSLHGMNKDAWKRYTAQGSWYYELVAPGYKYNLTDMAAGLGLQQLKRADEFLYQRREIARRYSEGFSSNVSLELPPVEDEKHVHSWHLYSIRLNLETINIDRDKFIEVLKEQGIFCSVHWMPLHLHPYYRKTYSFDFGMFPTAENIWFRQISLPIYPAMTDEQVSYVIKKVNETCQSYQIP